MKKYHLGEFEEVVMLTVGLLYGKAYGVSIKDEIESRLERNVSVGALQTTLRRLEKKGYLESKQGESTENRGGRPRLYFSVTAYGLKVLRHTKEVRDDLWKAQPQIILKAT